VDIIERFIEEEWLPFPIGRWDDFLDRLSRIVEHAHIHVIPRYEGDVKMPQGGVRGVIPDKMDYPQEE
jgi:hypothetical protein